MSAQAPIQTPRRILLVTGLSGAGKATALRTFEDLGWEVVDNLPLSLFDRLIAAAQPADDEERPLAIGLDGRTRGFDAADIVRRVAKLRARQDIEARILFLDCSSTELERRFSETRRRHPLALDRPAEDGIARERTLLWPLREAADHLIDTSDTSVNALQGDLRARFGDAGDDAMTLTVMSFGYARGVPRNADLMFDMRFLRNPHWEPELKPLTGQDDPVAAYVAADPAYEDAMQRIEELLRMLLPRYADTGKAYVTAAFGCTGGKHRSVHVAETMAGRLRSAGFSPTVVHRDLARKTPDAAEEARPAVAK